MRRLLQNRTFIAVACVVALIVVVELVGFGVGRLRDSLSPLNFIIIGGMLIVLGISIAYLVDAVRAKSRNR